MYIYISNVPSARKCTCTSFLNDESEVIAFHYGFVFFAGFIMSADRQARLQSDYFEGAQQITSEFYSLESHLGNFIIEATVSLLLKQLCFISCCRYRQKLIESFRLPFTVNAEWSCDRKSNVTFTVNNQL